MQIGMLCRLLLVAMTIIPTCMQYIPKKCPRYRYQWLQKSKEMCGNEDINGSYHCFVDQNGNVTEMCFKATRINPDQEGCPKFELNSGIINILKPFDPCPANNKECPRKFHRYYYTDELYKYADCIPLDSAPSTEATETEAPLMCPSSKERNSECQCCGVIIASFLVLLWILLLQRKQIMEDFRQIINFCDSLHRSWKGTTDKGGVAKKINGDHSQEVQQADDSGNAEQHALQELLSDTQPEKDNEDRINIDGNESV